MLFCLPNHELESNEALDYCTQEALIDELFSYMDLYRHPIREDDAVLVPGFLVDPMARRKLDLSQPLEPPFAGQPYVLAKVIAGFESRKGLPYSICLNCLLNSTMLYFHLFLSSGDLTSHAESTSMITVQVSARASNRSRIVDIPAGCALWLPNKKASRLQATGEHFFEGQRSTRDGSPFREEKDTLCMHKLYSPVHSPHRSKDCEVATVEDTTTVSDSLPFLAQGIKSMRLRPLHKRGDSADSALSLSSSMASFERGNQGMKERGRSKSSRRNGGLCLLVS